jgi:hypothetical protein
MCLACAGPVSEQQLSEQVPLATSKASLYVKSSTVWPGGEIEVCWENPDSAHAAEREWVMDAVHRTWVAAAPLYFTGWSRCGHAQGGIRIRVADERPHVKVLGNGLNAYPSGMVLNFTFGNWNTSCQSTREFCIRTLAVHEFGHALGFAHEQDRPDTPSWCNAEQGVKGDWVIGPWDANSVMNYCNPNWAGNGQLSATDIEGVRAVYGVYPVCGDYFCGQHETRISCPTDCYCGDGVCDRSEGASCYWDCYRY